MSQSLSRALDLLREIVSGTNSLDGLAATAGVHKTTVLRLLNTLEEHGFVTRDAGFRYHLGPAMFELTQTALEEQDVRGVASQHLRALGAATGQTVHLAAYEDGSVFYIDKVESRQPLRMYSRVGLPASLYATGVAKVLLGGLDPAERRRIVNGIVFERYTDKTITDADALLADIERSKERGWAEDHEEHESFMNCVAAPVFGPDGRIAAAVSISVPTMVLPHADVRGLLPQLLATTAAISIELGYAPAEARTPSASVTPTTAATEPHPAT
ncbi:IclR family transcriptional regulator [Plantibacter flavus]|uniref:IclR family transcriptional regulator n=1 Tax=Plantibacter flavus TaxID=150123 RepID=UPI003F190C47